jgi:hypothetical protein
MLKGLTVMLDAILDIDVQGVALRVPWSHTPQPHQNTAPAEFLVGRGPRCLTIYSVYHLQFTE